MTADELIDLGLDHQMNRRFAEAEACYRQAIALDELIADAHNLLGTVLQGTNRLAEAIVSHRRALELDSTDPAYLNNLATALRIENDPQAVDYFRQALALEPAMPDTCLHLGVFLIALGRAEEAIEPLRQLVHLRPNDPAAHNNLGSAYRFSNRTDEALAEFRKALELKPNWPIALDNLVRTAFQNSRADEVTEDAAALAAIEPENFQIRMLQLLVLNAAKRWDEVVSLAPKVVAKFPDSVEPHFQLAHAFQQRGEFAPAIIALKKCLEMEPESLTALNRLGWVLFLIGQPMQARDVFLEATHLDENSGECWTSLSIAYHAMNENQLAIEAARKGAELQPTQITATLQLIYALMKDGRHAEADVEIEKGEKQFGEHAQFLIQRATIAGERGLTGQAIRLFERARDLDASMRHVGGVAAMFYNYLDTTTPEEVFAAHRRWADQYLDITNETSRAPDRFDITVDPNRRLRVGLLSPDFRGHSVAFFLLPLMQNIDRERFEVVCLDNTRLMDHMSGMMHGMGFEWHRLVGVTDKVAAGIIRKLKIDVLIDLGGHTSDSRLPAMMFRPAPVQWSYLGYPNTTGLPTVDYRIVDSHTDPPGPADALSVEQLIRLDPIFLCYAPQHTPDVVPPPCLKNGYTTFGSFNNFMKASDTTVRMWSRVLTEMPESRMLIKSSGLGDDATRKRVSARFAAYGIEADRLTFVARMRDNVEHLQLYGIVDVALDTYPYAGTTTTCEALWMGVPVITLEGEHHASRVSGSILSAIGHAEWAAQSEQDFVNRAVRLASDPNRLLDARTALRQQMADSALMDHSGFTRRFEIQLRQTWQVWCRSVS